MNIKKYFTAVLLIMIASIPLAAQEKKLASIISQFGSNLGTRFQTGMDLQSKDMPFFAREDCEVVFVNKRKPDSIQYPCGNLILLQNKSSDLRCYYSGIADDSYDEHIVSYSQGEFIGMAGNSGTNDKEILHVEMEDLENHRLLNPAIYFDVPDTKKPVINDLFFIDIHNREISLFQTKKVIRGGKLFIKCSDYITDNSSVLMPYKIDVFINGEEFCSLSFESMDKKNKAFYLSDSEKDFFALYQINSPNVFFLKEQYFLPGLLGIKVVVRDFAGNSSSYTTSFRVLPN
ncbi:MAG: hypothetical protein J1G30_06160 [Spirochaetales bacterium]|nr:hypothetical protein [Spirochaetales bacterium]